MKTDRSCRALVVLLLTGSLTAVACSVRDDYETLSFWFDGVPTQEELAEEEAARAETAAERLEPQGPGRERRQNVPPLPEGFSRHEPYAQKDCGACHETKERGGGGFYGGVPKLRFPQQELCLQCHDPEVAAVVHGPAAAGACSICHVAHQSGNPSLVRYESLNQLCVECHTDEVFVTRRKHKIWEAQDCVDCHDPHASDHPSLLREPQE